MNAVGAAAIEDKAIVVRRDARRPDQAWRFRDSEDQFVGRIRIGERQREIGRDSRQMHGPRIEECSCYFGRG